MSISEQTTCEIDKKLYCFILFNKMRNWNQLALGQAFLDKKQKLRYMIILIYPSSKPLKFFKSLIKKKFDRSLKKAYIFIKEHKMNFGVLIQKIILLTILWFILINMISIFNYRSFLHNHSLFTFFIALYMLFQFSDRLNIKSSNS